MTSKTAKIRLKSISKSFIVNGKPKPVLTDIDFTVNEGELVSIVGPSGCGKTTLFNVIAGLEEADAGMVEVNGDPTNQRLGKIGYMHQKDLLLPWRTVLDNTTLGLELQGVSRHQARQKALDLTETFGLKGFENQYPFALSGGMRQRASFLRTMLLDQDIMLLDEPFGALDALTRAQMQEWLLKLWYSVKNTIVLVTHDIDEALLLSDRIYVLSARPAKVKMILDVNLPRPRHYHKLASQPAFVGMKARLLDSLHRESRKKRGYSNERE